MAAQWYAVGMGSNLGDRLEHLRGAVESLSHRLEVLAVSSLYESAPVGYRDQGDFLNAVMLVRTDLKPGDLLSLLLELEAASGRTRDLPGGPRTLDLDVILWEGGVVHEPGLRIPHPRWKERAFVLAPLAEVGPHLRDPESSMTVEELWSDRESSLEVVTRVSDRDWAPVPAQAALEDQG